MLKSQTTREFFEIQRIYLKNISFKSPNTPKIFCKNWDPNIKFNLNIAVENIKKNIFEVILKIKIVVTIQTELVFLCNVHQAGIFCILNLDEKKLRYCLYAYCPDILFPYSRSCISNLVSNASFPSLNIAPVNFHDMYYNNIKNHQDVL
ncbi:MAG: protein-export chaperone SecB [Buchnera aphidicola (Pentalonia nigronervosa)]|jgi:preprotein translocase subunit SecB|uniref:Protein-export protein SecB n=1 Tax=Buchnera aphidicola (Pentalonia nigronervosa) TaxID=1309793 RepID=A0A7H1AZ97_9GAMM|nr:MAG: protein-export chaperone SecB [Buchnera aphidicola (Pentalonia nigronervosa)]